MGTNYYVAKNKCDCCKRYDKEYHIGKSSWGWSFTFQGYKYDKLSSWKQWKKYLKTQTIVDEYGDEMPYDEFVTMIETYKSPNYVNKNGRKNLHHNTQGKIDSRPWYHSEYDWDDQDGYAFTSREFS